MNPFNQKLLINIDLSKLIKFLFIQIAIISVFLAIVYADRLILDDVFKQYDLIKYVRLFHWVFFDILSTITYASLGIVYAIAKGKEGWKIGLAIFIEGIALIRLGMEDYCYYLLFKDVVPSKLPWLNYNPVFVTTTFAVTKAGLELSIIISLSIIAIIWVILWKKI
ncbi:MAG: hypothetical protein QW589_05885 [Candidatus Bathyarchaeia archaeon]